MNKWIIFFLSFFGIFLLFKFVGNISYLYNYQKTSFYPNLTSISKHKIPDWYNDVKIGIKINWGLYSIPCFAPKLSKYENRTEWSFKNPSTDWYINTMNFQGSETQKFHEKYYKNNGYFDQFTNEFQESVKNWIPSLLISSLLDSGAKYVILNVKSHDGWKLWPNYGNFAKTKGSIQRNIVNDFLKHSTKQNLYFGVSYSALDLSQCPKCDKYQYYEKINQIDHQETITNDLKELIINDLDLLYIEHSQLQLSNDMDIVSYYYNKKNSGIINDKLSNSWKDVETFEYEEPNFIPLWKWELQIPFGKSNGFNFNEGRYDLIDDFDLIETLIRVVSRNGNLVLNIGLNPKGYIPEAHLEKLQKFGKWLKRYGESIYESKPWKIPEITINNVKLYFTQNIEKNIIFIFVVMRDDKVNHIEITKEIFGNEDRHYFLRMISGRFDNVIEDNKTLKIEFQKFHGKRIFVLKLTK